MEVTLHIGPGLYPLPQGKQVAVGKVDALRVVHLAVQVDAVGAGKAVLRDKDGQAVPLMEKPRAPLHGFGGDGPADGRARMTGGTGAEFRLAVGSGTHRDGVVDVHADKVQPPQRQGIQLLLRDGVNDALCLPALDLRPLAQHNRIQRRTVGEGPVAVLQVKHGLPGGGDIGGAVGGRRADAARGGNAHQRRQVCLADGVRGQTMRVNCIVPCAENRAVIELIAGRVCAGGIAEADAALRLIQREIVCDAATEVFCHHAGIFGKGLGGIRIEPAALILQSLRQIPVIERDIRLNACSQQRIDKAAVPRKALDVHRAGAARDNARPGNRETVGLQVHGLEQLDVLRPAVVAVAGNVAGVTVHNAARRMGKGIPDGNAAASL